MRASRGPLTRLLPRGRMRLRFWLGFAAIVVLIVAYRYYMRYAGAGSAEGAMVLLGMLLAFLGLLALALMIGLVMARLTARRRNRFAAALLDELAAEETGNEHKGEEK